MNGAVHYNMTKQWAIEEGFSEAEAEIIATADNMVDHFHTGKKWRNWGWHFALLGAWPRARILLRRATQRRDPVILGESLHCIQDSISHGVWGMVHHWDGIDRWERRSASVQARIERATRRYLASYRSRVADRVS